MESGDGARVKTAISRPGQTLASRSRLTSVSRGGVLMDLEMRTEMKIIQFPENIDKFPTKFDKFLQQDGLVND